MKKKKKKNNNKVFGLCKERELVNYLKSCCDVLYVNRSRGSFGSFDIICFRVGYCELISVKSSRARYYSPISELRKLSCIKLPSYCVSNLYVYYGRSSNHATGWYYHPELKKECKLDVY